MKEKTYWYPCPRCGNKKLIKIRKDTKFINCICYCKSCKTENVLNDEVPQCHISRFD